MTVSGAGLGILASALSASADRRYIDYLRSRSSPEVKKINPNKKKQQAQKAARKKQRGKR